MHFVSTHFDLIPWYLPSTLVKTILFELSGLRYTFFFAKTIWTEFYIFGHLSRNFAHFVDRSDFEQAGLSWRSTKSYKVKQSVTIPCPSLHFEVTLVFVAVLILRLSSFGGCFHYLFAYDYSRSHFILRGSNKFKENGWSSLID